MPLTPAQIRRHFDAAEGYLQLGMVDHALTELSAIGNTEDVEYDYHRLLGECFRARQDWAAALAEFEQCNHLQPDTLDILMAMAWCYKRLDRLGDAIDTMLSAYETHRNESIVLYNLSCYYRSRGTSRRRCRGWGGRCEWNAGCWISSRKRPILLRYGMTPSSAGCWNSRGIDVTKERRGGC